MRRSTKSTRQSGIALVTGLVMLVVLTLLVLAGVNMTSVNSKIAYNMQLRNEADAATQQAIENVVSSAANFDTPVPAQPPVAVDINNDGKTDFTVNVATPKCIASTPIKQSQLDASNPQDLPCFGSSALQNSGIVGGKGSNGNSLCANATWDVAASISDPTSTGLNVTTHQGVNLRVVAGSTC